MRETLASAFHPNVPQADSGSFRPIADINPPQHLRRADFPQPQCVAATQKQNPKTTKMNRQRLGTARRLTTPVARIGTGEERREHDREHGKGQCEDHDWATQRLEEITAHVFLIHSNAPSSPSRRRRVAQVPGVPFARQHSCWPWLRHVPPAPESTTAPTRRMCQFRDRASRT